MHEGEGAAKMRETLGPDAVPEVDVCFSQKYSDQVDRINTNWLPIYTKQFPAAKPRFLTDETDPGAATKFGTITGFVASIGAGGGAQEDSDDELYRPQQETPQGWADYVHGLLHGANGDPFYTPAELDTRQVSFFSDPAVLGVLGHPSRYPQHTVPGSAAEYFKDPKVFKGFWHKIAADADTALFKQYCLRAQGVLMPSALEAMPPVVVQPAEAPTGASGGRGQPYTVLAAAAMGSTAVRLAATDPSRFEYHPSKWRTFPDGTDNITLGGFEPEDKVSGRDVLFLATFDNNASTLSQLHALTWLCESAFISSLTVLLAYLPTGTMERYLQPGRIPAANTLAKMLSGLPSTGGKRTRIMIYDVHAPPTQFFFGNTCAATLHTACPLAIGKINAMDKGEKIDCVARGQFQSSNVAPVFSKWPFDHVPTSGLLRCFAPSSS